MDQTKRVFYRSGIALGLCTQNTDIQNVNKDIQLWDLIRFYDVLKCAPILTATGDKSERNGSLYEGSGAATVNDVVLGDRMSPAEEYIGYHCHHARL